MATQAHHAASDYRSAFNQAHNRPGGHAQASHTHSHAHSHNLTRQALRLGFLLTVAILLVEIIGGLLSHSLALLSDAGHVFTDVIALGLAWFAAAQAERPANERRTFGYHRIGILVALFNGVTLVLIALIIGFEAYQRLRAPTAVHPGIMVGAALVAIVVNLFIARRLHGGESLNARAALLHAVGDIGASAAVVIGAIVITVTGASWVDPVISVAIAALIALGSFRLIIETTNILMESTPEDISTEQVAGDICSVNGVLGVHDMHVWTITSGIRALSCHAIIDDIPPSASARILDRVTDLLQSRYRISHATIQFESEKHESHDGHCACEPRIDSRLYCALSPEDCGCHDHSGHSH